MTHENPAHENAEASGLHLFLNAGIELGRHVDALSAKVDKLAALQKSPTVVTLTASGVFTTGQPLVMPFPNNGPDVGTIWEINRWTVGGVDGHTTAAGKAVLYAAGYNADAGGGMANVVDLTGTLPYCNHYGARQIYVTPTENVWATINGGTNGQQYVTNISITVYDLTTLGNVATVA